MVGDHTLGSVFTHRSWKLADMAPDTRSLVGVLGSSNLKGYFKSDITTQANISTAAANPKNHPSTNTHPSIRTNTNTTINLNDSLVRLRTMLQQNKKLTSTELHTQFLMNDPKFNSLTTNVLPLFFICIDPSTMHTQCGGSARASS